MKIFFNIFFFQTIFFSATAQIDNSFRDTNNFAILSINFFKIHAFDSTHSASILTEDELVIIEKLFFRGIDEYNSKLSKELDSIYKDSKEKDEIKNDLLVHISKQLFVKQLFPAMNKKGRK